MNCHPLPTGGGRLLLSPHETPSSGGGFSFENEPLTFFDPTQPVTTALHSHLHLQQGAVPCFVTWRPADSLAQATLRKWKAEQDEWLRANPKPWDLKTELNYLHRYERGINRRLRQGIGSCLLRDPEIARIVADALLHFNGDRYELIAFVIMPNHVHVLFRPHPDHSLSTIVKNWKGYTAWRINRHLNRKGELWYETYFDSLIRNDVHLRNCIRYIRRNPPKARLPQGEYLLWQSPIAKQVPD